MLCAACGTNQNVDRAHLKSRGAGAKWEWFEWLPLCRNHHQEQHKLGWYRFVQTNPNVIEAMTSRGWYFQNNFGIWRLRRKHNFIETKSQTL